MRDAPELDFLARLAALVPSPRLHLPNRLWWMRSCTSPQMCTGSRANMSSVSTTRPSVLFSMGAIPYSAWPRFTSSKTAAILPVHWAGCPPEMGKILEIASRHGIPVVEDEYVYT